MAKVKLQFFKVTALPGSPEANSVYFVKADDDAPVFEYVTDEDGVATQVGATPVSKRWAAVLTGGSLASPTVTENLNEFDDPVVTTRTDVGRYNFANPAFADDNHTHGRVTLGINSSPSFIQFGVGTPGVAFLRTFFDDPDTGSDYADFDASVHIMIEVFNS